MTIAVTATVTVLATKTWQIRGVAGSSAITDHSVNLVCNISSPESQLQFYNHRSWLLCLPTFVHSHSIMSPINYLPSDSGAVQVLVSINHMSLHYRMLLNVRNNLGSE